MAGKRGESRKRRKPEGKKGTQRCLQERGLKKGGYVFSNPCFIHLALCLGPEGLEEGLLVHLHLYGPGHEADDPWEGHHKQG
jgi:hypothetical protein